MTQNSMEKETATDPIEMELAEEIAASSTMPEVDANEPALYEIAFHILSTVGDDKVGEIEAKIRATIEEHGGSIAAAESPKSTKLAYGIPKLTEGKNRMFTDAYFGWFRANILPAKIVEVQEALTLDPSILRFIIIRLTREEIANPFNGFVGMKQKGAAELQTTISQKPDTAEEQSEAGKEVSEEELDKAIEDIAATVDDKEKKE